MTMSSIFRIILTTSVERVKALSVTRVGCMICSAMVLSTMTPVFPFKPQFFSPCLCLALIAVTILTGLRPQFSARV